MENSFHFNFLFTKLTEFNCCSIVLKAMAENMVNNSTSSSQSLQKSRVSLFHRNFLKMIKQWPGYVPTIVVPLSGSLNSRCWMFSLRSIPLMVHKKRLVLTRSKIHFVTLLRKIIVKWLGQIYWAISCKFTSTSLHWMSVIQNPLFIN